MLSLYILVFSICCMLFKLTVFLWWIETFISVGDIILCGDFNNFFVWNIFISFAFTFYFFFFFSKSLYFTALGWNFFPYNKLLIDYWNSLTFIVISDTVRFCHTILILFYFIYYIFNVFSFYLGTDWLLYLFASSPVFWNLFTQFHSFSNYS